MPAKNIVLCSDGTGNSAVKGRGTNVYKLYESVDVNGFRETSGSTEQIAFYDDGVGTESSKVLKALGGAIGLGLSRNVMDLYKDLVRVYSPGDRIYLFGFSRGAFTVRTLAGFILAAGIISWDEYKDSDELDDLVKRAYVAYRRRHRAYLQRLIDLLLRRESGTGLADEFRKQYAVKDPELAPDGKAPIAFIGVWDTVDAVGLPVKELAWALNKYVHQYKFSDYKLGEGVERACHALSIDDERHTFHPYMWDEIDERKESNRIEQVWFPGVHANVGGGYPKQGLSLVPLDWMMDRAGKAGLDFIRHDRELYRERMNADDKLYDPRAGVKVFYRFKPRDIAELCSKNNVQAKIHVCAVQRIANGTLGYAPGSYPGDATVVTTPAAGADTEDKLAKIQSEIQARMNGMTSPSDRVRSHILSRRVLHLFFLVLTGAIVCLTFRAGILSSEHGSIQAFFATAGEFLSFKGYRRVLGVLAHHPYLPALLLVIYVSTYVIRKRMRRSLSEFWHPLQKNIKKILEGLN